MLQLCPLERSHKKESLHVKSVKIFLCFSLQESVIIDSIFVLVNTRCLRYSRPEEVGSGRSSRWGTGAAEEVSCWRWGVSCVLHRSRGAEQAQQTGAVEECSSCANFQRESDDVSMMNMKLCLLRGMFHSSINSPRLHDFMGEILRNGEGFLLTGSF